MLLSPMTPGLWTTGSVSKSKMAAICFAPKEDSRGCRVVRQGAWADPSSPFPPVMASNPIAAPGGKDGVEESLYQGGARPKRCPSAVTAPHEGWEAKQGASGRCQDLLPHCKIISKLYIGLCPLFLMQSSSNHCK